MSRILNLFGRGIKMSNVNLIVKNEKGKMSGLSLETHTSFTKYAVSLTREKTSEEVAKRIEGYSKYYGKKVEEFQETPTSGMVFLFDEKSANWMTMSAGKLVKISDKIKEKEALVAGIEEKREAVTKFLAEIYGISGEKLKGMVARMESDLLK